MVFIFDSHPVQYKAPVYQWMQKLRPDTFRVIYISDCSLQGYSDRDFGKVITWDVPLLSGYQSTILHNERGVPLSGFRSLTGRGIFQLFRDSRPQAVMFSQFLYEADLVACLSCLWLGIPIWIRHETQDEAFKRPFWKSILRSILYRIAYLPVRHGFYIGQLNRQHLLRHGVSSGHMSRSPYCTVLPASALSDEIKWERRAAMRHELGVAPDETLLLFSGKLIEKKNPGLILQALLSMSSEELSRFKVVFVGSGDLTDSLKVTAASLAGRVLFAGFVNQSKITEYYLAADILVLPSRPAGETWGLVVNEALQVGCTVVMTESVGCHPEFEKWERVRVIPDNDSDRCAWAIRDLSKFSRSFAWCREQMEDYSVRAAAEAIVRQIDALESTSQPASSQ